METPHFSRLGSVYVVNDLEGVVLFQADFTKEALRLKGIQITPEIEQLILRFCRERQAEIVRQYDSEGLPDKLNTLFEFTKKSKAVAYCKRIQLSEHEMFLLAHNCSQIGFTHTGLSLLSLSLKA